VLENNLYITRWKVLWESTTSREIEILGFCRQHLATLATPTIRSIKCKQSLVYEVFDRYLHIPLPIVTKHEFGLPFPPRNLAIKFGTNPSTIFLVIVITDRQTDTQTNAGKNIPLFRGENNPSVNLATGVAYVDGRKDGWGSGGRNGRRRRARTDDVRRPAACAGEGRGVGTARGLRRTAKPQSSVARLWLVILKNSFR